MASARRRRSRTKLRLTSQNFWHQCESHFSLDQQLYLHRDRNNSSNACYNAPRPEAVISNRLEIHLMAGILRDQGRITPCWLAALLLLLVSTAKAQSPVEFTLAAASLQNGQAVELDKLPWKYHPGDPAAGNPAWSDAQFDDRDWETLNGTAITLDRIPKSGWRGLGWFRLRLNSDPALAQQPLALVMVHYGASEVYLDGKLVQRFGRVGTTPDTEVAYNPNTLPINIVLD